MATPQPTEQLIQDFNDWTANHVSRDEIIRRLMANGNNMEAATNEYWQEMETGTTGGKYKVSTWDETPFNSDRDGAGNHHGISFDIQGPDDAGPYPQHFDSIGAPSRPPSRTSDNKSPLSKIIDLTAEHAAADPRNSLTPHEQAERELQEALAASRVEAGLPPQETGITTSTSDVHFGPATRSDYESGKWDMVMLGKTPSQERAMDPEPAFRKREEGVPAFLKTSSQNYRLGALLTIYHEIPTTRNIFLNAKDPVQNYGYDNEWWSGKAITFQDESNQTVYLPLDRELQRLMAFLDNTDRSYGSVDGLALLPEVKQERRKHSKLELAVLWTWYSIQRDANPGMVRQIFSKGVASEEEDIEEQAFAILELSLPFKDSPQDTLYDIADETLWPSLGALQLEKSPYLSHIAEVIAFKVEGSDEEHKAVDIPAIWYPDRYLKAGRQAALEMRLQKSAVDQELQRLQMMEERLTFAQVKPGKTVKVQDLFKACLKHDEAELEDKGEDVHMEHEMIEQVPSQAAARLSSELRKVMDSIDRKLTALNVEKEKAKEELRKLSKLYTEQSTDPNEPKLTKYTLRGVSTTKNTMYVCQRADPDLIDLDDERVIDQWWRIHYNPLSTKPVHIEKTTEAKVLDAAKNESKNTFLVYASEKAMNRQKNMLPKQLETFVLWDNKTFGKELKRSNGLGDDTAGVNLDEGVDEGVDGDGATPNSNLSSVTMDDIGGKVEVEGNVGAEVKANSPGKRKFDERLHEDSDFEDEKYRAVGNGTGSWGAAQTVSRELMHDVNGSGEGEVIVGVDPSLIVNGGREMEEREGALPMLSGRPRSVAELGMGIGGTIDGMDLDEEGAEEVDTVLGDEKVVQESRAVGGVKRVGFK